MAAQSLLSALRQQKCAIRQLSITANQALQQTLSFHSSSLGENQKHFLPFPCKRRKDTLPQHKRYSLVEEHGVSGHGVSFSHFGAGRFVQLPRCLSTSVAGDGEEKSNDETLHAASIVPLDDDSLQQAIHVGYEVVGRVTPADFGRIRRHRAFAIVQVGSHQFKVSPGDCIYTEKLKYADINDKLRLEKVLLLGSRSQTIIGRPIVPKAHVHAAVEEHALDAKDIIFKKKRRKNYRRTTGHRQELTRLRILEIRGLGEDHSAI